MKWDTFDIRCIYVYVLQQIFGVKVHKLEFLKHVQHDGYHLALFMNVFSNNGELYICGFTS